MSDHKHKEENFLGKKTNRKRRASQKVEKELDIKKFKERIFSELANTPQTT
jgi:hypothetical protein